MFFPFVNRPRRLCFSGFLPAGFPALLLFCNRLSIPKIASIKQDLSDAGVVLKRVKTSIYALPQPHTEQITEMVNQGKQVVDQIDEAFDTLNTIVEKIPG